MTKKIKLVIECDEYYVADSLHELASTIECGDKEYDELGTMVGDHYKAVVTTDEPDGEPQPTKTIQAGDSYNYESVSVSTDPVKTPVAWKNRVNDLIKSGCTQEEAESMAREPIDMEMFYEEGAGLFLVESGATECVGVCKSPYTGAEIVPYED